MIPANGVSLASVVSTAIAEGSPDILLKPTSVRAWHRLRRIVVDRVAQWHVDQLPDDEPESPKLTGPSGTMSTGTGERLCVKCLRSGGRNRDPMPEGWLSWSLGHRSLYTLGWACSQECVTALLVEQVEQFYSEPVVTEAPR